MSKADDIDALFAEPVPDSVARVFPGAVSVSVDEMDSIMPEERRNLVAFCEHCEAWWNFVRDMDPTPEEEICPTCGGGPSQRQGFQPTTQRSFNPILANKKKLPKKR